MSLRAVIASIFLFCLFCLFCATGSAQVGDARYAHLARGVNLTRWFLYGSPQPITARDRDLLLKAGFTCVRIAVAPQYLLPKWASPEKISTTLANLDRGIDLFLNSGMAVMLDFQADNEYRDYYLSTPAAPQELADTWRMLAARYANRNPDLLFFEIMNEPDTRFTQAEWDAEQTRVLAAIREAAPRNTVLLSPVDWSGLDALVETTPVPDPNVIYVLHYYLPMPFTHQGATWTAPELATLRNIPWPAFLANPETSPAIREYTDDDRDARSIDWDMSLAAQWSKRWNVKVVVNEFGAYKPFSPPDSRARWLHDVRVALDRYHLAWSMWDYGAGFDLITDDGDKRAIDPDVSAALGLTKWNRPDPSRTGPAPAFTSARTVQLGASPEATGYADGILAADIDGDGLPDIVIAPVTWPSLAENPIELFLNKGSSLFEPAPFDGPAPEERFVSQIVAGHFDRSGRPGFFFPDRGPEDGSGAQSRLALPSGENKLRDATANIPQEIVRTTGAAAGDADGSGADDLVVFNPNPQLWKNDGTGHFHIDAGAFPPSEGEAFTCGIFLDRNLAVFGPDEGRLYLNDGEGRFTAGPAFPVPPENGGPAIGGCALAARGRIIVAFKNDELEVLNPNHPAEVQTVTLEASKKGVRRIVLAQDDLVVTRPGEAPLILKYRGEGGFETAKTHLTPGLSIVVPADVNRDGKLDLIFGQGPRDPLVARFGQ